MSYLHKQFAQFGVGNMRMKPEYSVDGQEKEITYQEVATPHVITLYGKNEEISDEFLIYQNKTGYTVRRTVKNISGKTLKLNCLKISFNGIDFGYAKRDDYFYSLENARIYCTYTFPIDYKRTEDDALNSEFDVVANNRWADPGVVSDKINASPYQPFPAILVGNYQGVKGLVHGTLSQDVCYHYHLLKHNEKGVLWEVFSAFKGLSYLEFEADRYLVDEWYIGVTEEADCFDKLFDGYTAELRKKLPNNYGATDINRDNLVWGSWNDGIFRDISEDMLLKEAKALKEQFPAIRWLQVDDGYAVLNEHPHGLCMPYEGAEGVDKKKFPQGLRHYTDELRKIGLRPAIWVGGFCPINGKLYQDKPEWFLDYTERIYDKRPLDVSQPQVREYMEKALDSFAYEYGFDSIKHDFWSYAFEESKDWLTNKTASGYELRRWWLQTVRKKLPKDGYFQTGCDIVLANPFLGEYFTNYRYGIDVGCGHWTNVKTTMAWGAVCFATHTGDLFVPNSDAVGLLPNLNDNDFLCWLNFVMITHSMVEISGRYSLGGIDEKRLAMLKKATCCVNNGQEVYTANFDYRKKEMPAPEVYYTKTPIFSTEESNGLTPLRTLAILNINEEEKEYKISLDDLGLCGKKKYILTDVWSGEKKVISENIFYRLGCHESKLLHIADADMAVICDCNAKLSHVRTTEHGVSGCVENCKQVTMSVTKKIACVRVNGIQKGFEQKGGEISFALEDNANVELIFKK